MKVGDVHMWLIAELTESGQFPESRRFGVLNGPMDAKFGAEPNNIIREFCAAEAELESRRASCFSCNRKTSAWSTEVDIPNSAFPKPSEDDLSGVVPENVIVLATLDLNRRGYAKVKFGTGS